MSATMSSEDRELLRDSQRHICEKLGDHWAMLTIKDGEGTIWDNSTISDSEYNSQPTRPILLGLSFCPFCGRRLGSADAATVAVTDAIRIALKDAKAAANLEVDREKWLTANSLVQYLDVDGLDLVQVVITQPWLARRYTPTPQQTP